MTQGVTFQKSNLEAFSFKVTGSLVVEMDIDDTITLDFTLTNHWTYDMYYNFSGNVPSGFVTQV